MAINSGCGSGIQHWIAHITGVVNILIVGVVQAFSTWPFVKVTIHWAGLYTQYLRGRAGLGPR